MNDFHMIPSASTGLFQIIPVIIGLAFLIAAGTLVFKGVTGIAEWSNNNGLPIVDVAAKIVAKRVDTKIHRHHHNHGNHIGFQSRTTSTNKYFVTFENENGERLAFQLKPKDFDLLIEHDHGILTHQGTRYHHFCRTT